MVPKPAYALASPSELLKIPKTMPVFVGFSESFPGDSNVQINKLIQIIQSVERIKIEEKQSFRDM